MTSEVKHLGAGVIDLATIQPTPVKWLWPRWVPLGTVTVVDGDPGLGKSTLLLDLVARVTRDGVMPDGSQGKSGNVLLLSAEDSMEQTVVPRLLAAAADMQRIRHFRDVADQLGTRPPLIPDDLDAVEEMVKERQVVLVVIDPLMAYLSTMLDSSRDHHMRRALYHLASLADRQGCAIILLRHLNKQNHAKAIYRGGGSIGIIAAARSALLVTKDPADDKLRLVMVMKSNLSEMPPARRYELVRQEGQAVHIAWRGEANVRPDEALQGGGMDESGTLIEEAAKMLTELLSVHDWPVHDLNKEMEKAGIAPRTLKRAKSLIGARSYHSGYGKGSQWIWTLKPTGEEGFPVNVPSPDNQQATEKSNPIDDLIRQFEQTPCPAFKQPR
jgi:hypothetical protein